MTASLFSDPEPAEALSGAQAPTPALDPFHASVPADEAAVAEPTTAARHVRSGGDQR